MKEEDILARQSRPQRYSTWIPKTRDWRYATGVFQHDDFEDAPKDRSAWDTMDYDYQTSGDTMGKRDGLSRSGSGSSSEVGVDDMMMTMGTPDSGRSHVTTESPKARIPVRAAKKARSPRNNVWTSVTRFNPSRRASNGEENPEYEAISLIVRLRFTGTNIAELQRIASESADHPPTPQSLTRIHTTGAFYTPKAPSSPETPASARTADTIHTPHILDSIESIHTFPLFQRSWIDETRDFNMKAVCSTLRGSNEKVEELGAKYKWYADAVPIDAIFPPGVPLSAKEINAYYPHHVRRKGVMLRLTNNDYRGPDIMGIQAFFRGPPTHAITTSQMNSYQRDAVKSTIPSFKVAGYKGKPDHSLYTDDLAMGKYLDDARKSFSLPSFGDLLCGLQHLPTGLDARGLTQCLAWYLNFRDSFTPRLELNVLHTQALIRALRHPLKPFGPQNLDRNALQEWRDNGGFDELKVQQETKTKASLEEMEEQHRTQLHLNPDEDSVRLRLTIPIRHVFTFPFCALQGLVGEALRLGIEKAGMRQAEREREKGRRALEANWAASLVSENDAEPKETGSMVVKGTKVIEEEQHQAVEEKKSYRIPKRPRQAEDSFPPQSSSKKPRTAPPSNTAYGRRDFQFRPPVGPGGSASRHGGPFPHSSRYPHVG